MNFFHIFFILSKFRELDQACMEAVASLLRGLPLQPEESDRGDLMEAKSQLFLKFALYEFIIVSLLFSNALILQCKLFSTGISHCL